MIRKILILSVFITGLALTSCGSSKKPQEKVDHGKVDKAYNDFNNKNQ